MCGIAGRYSPRGVTLEEILPLGVHLRHRGPDDHGAYLGSDGLLGLAHRRLSIIDLSDAGHQPMVSSSGQQVISYNGEIYNYEKLRTELQGAGITFRSRTDTETILEYLARHGDDAVQAFRGMFAYAYWDAGRGKLLLARDRLGKKPLYYSEHEGTLTFSSELKALLRAGFVAPKLDPRGLLSYLSFGSVYEPETIVEGVRLLPAAHMAELGKGPLRVRSYWTPSPPDIEKNESDPIPRLKEILLESTRMRLISDVPLGVFLSGGIDSTALVALLRMCGSSRIRTFTAGFAEGDYDETSRAEQVAKRFETQHFSRTFTAEEVWREMPGVIRAMDQPTIDGVNTYFISKVAREGGVTVALSGLGSDEIFGGYPSFLHVPRLVKAARITSALPGGPALARLLLSRLGGIGSFTKAQIVFDGAPDSRKAYDAVRGLFVGAALEKLLVPDFRAEVIPPASRIEGDIERQVSWFELRRYMLNQLLRDTDAMSMTHSLEVRCPFLDHVLVDYVLSISGRWKAGSPPKKLLLDALGGAIPWDVFNRPKRGFLFPIGEWMRGPWKHFVEEILLDPHRCDQWIRREVVHDLWARFCSGHEHWARVWAVAVLKMWVSHHGITA